MTQSIKRIVLLLFFGFVLAHCSGGSSLTGGGGGGGGGGETITPEFEDGPVDIPITIGKVTGGIDPSTVEFAGSSPDLTAPLLSSVIKKQSVTGTLSGCLIDRSLTETVRGYVDGELRFTDTTESGCFQFTGVTSPIRIVTASCGDDVCGPPIIASVSTAGNVHVIMTNVAMNTTARLAVSPAGKIAFCGTGADGNPAIGVIPRAGELPEVLTTVSSCSQIRLRGYTSDEELVYIDTTQNKVLTVDTAGTTTEVDSTEDDQAYLRARGNSLAYATDADGKRVSVNGNEIDFETDDSNVIYRVFDWLDDDTLLVSEALNAGGSNLIKVNSTSSNEEAEISVVSYPVSISCNSSESCFALIDDGLAIGNNNLGEYDPASGFTTRLASRFLLNEQVCTSGPVFESDFGETLGNQIGFYNSENNEIVYASRFGTIPRCDPTNDNHSIFLCDSEDSGQICSFRPDFDQIEDGVVTHLFFLGDLQVDAGTCSSTSNVVVTDPNGVIVMGTVVSENTTISLDIVDDNGALYSTSDCTGDPITEVTIAAGSHTSSDFYYKPTSTGTAYLTAADPDDVLTKAAWKVNIP